jgi:protein O-GlcNAc transferase
MSVNSLLASALDYQKNGRLEESKLLFLKHLKSSPSDVVALYSLSSIELKLGSLERALTYIEKAISVRKDFAPSFLARSIIYGSLGQLEKAQADIKLAEALDPQTPGLAEHRYQVENLLSSPTTVGADEKGSYLGQLIAKGLTAQNNNDPELAKTIFEQILEVDANNFVALYSLGVLVGRSPFNMDPIPYLERAVAANPTVAMGHFALGTSLQNIGLLERAIESFDQAIALDPNYIEPYTNMSSALHALNRQADAISILERAIEKKPEDAKILANKGYLLTEFKENAWAAECFDKVLEVDREYPYARGLGAYARLNTCDWSSFERDKLDLIAGVREGKAVINPLAFKAFTDDGLDQMKCAVLFGADRFPPRDVIAEFPNYRHRRLRVAFLSADFREHPVGYLLISLIEGLKNESVDCIGVSFGVDDNSELYSRYRKAFTHVIDGRALASIEVASILRSMEIDIAIDLSGYTSGSRLDVLSYRPAPVQLTYLGFPGTLGLPYIDGLICDNVVIPPEHENQYTEDLIKLPFCYLPRDHSVLPSTREWTREELGLPKTATVYCTFNHDYKITPTIFNVWLEILREDNKGVLWLPASHDNTKKNILRYVAQNDIDNNRIVFSTRVPKIEDHLARYKIADVFLDTAPYNGHTTVSDSLYCGLPAITLSGESFASRVAHSLLNDLNQTTLVSKDFDEYKAKAINEANTHEKREIIRKSILEYNENWPNNERVTQFLDMISSYYASKLQNKNNNL